MHLRLLTRCLLRIARHRVALARAHTRRPAFLPSAANPEGSRRALLVHIVEPFFDTTLDVRHQNRWQVRELARCLAERGFRVDALAPGGSTPPGTPAYDLVVDLHPGISRYPDARLRIAYITGSNPEFSNRAERLRLEGLRSRRGTMLRPRRQVPEFSTHLRKCDAMFFIGSAGNLATYDQTAVPPVYYLRNFAYTPPILPIAPNANRGFMFLASGGQVHKGLDLLLEVFSQHHDWNLHVCSAFHEEPDFCRAFRKELFSRPNIIPHGFLHLESPEFSKCAAMCRHVLLPSCSEANAGSVLSGMAAGLIPIVSRETGFSADEVHFFQDCSAPCIEAKVAERIALAPATLEAEAARVRALVAHQYSPVAFTDSLEEAFNTLLGSRTHTL